MKTLIIILLSTIIAIAYPYDNTPLTDVEACQEANEPETTELFNCLSDGNYGPLYRERQNLLRNKGTLEIRGLQLQEERSQILADTTMDPLIKQQLLDNNAQAINQNEQDKIQNEDNFDENERVLEISIVVIPYDFNVACETGDSFCEDKLEACQPSYSEYVSVMNYCLMPEYEPKLEETIENTDGARVATAVSEERGSFEVTTGQTNVETELNSEKLNERATEAEFDSGKEDGDEALNEANINRGPVDFTNVKSDAIENPDDPRNAEVNSASEQAINTSNAALNALFNQ